MEITVLTLNCWGIAWVSKDRHPRMEAIAEELNTGKYDFVFLQEVWVEEDFKKISEKVTSVLPHGHYFHSGVVGGGVCILSKSEIIDVFFHAWPLNGYVHKILHGDWFAGKGVGLCTVSHKGLKINLYVTHLHAEYNPANDEYRAHRVAQAFETSQMIRQTRKIADLCILGGDLNTEPGDLPYRLIRYNASLQDSFQSTGKPEAEGTTSETPSNSYTSPESLISCPEGKRIDYIMYSSRKGLEIETIDCYNPLPCRVKNLTFSYSDHEAVCSKLRIVEGQTSNVTEEGCLEALQEAEYNCDAAEEKLKEDRGFYYLFAFGLITSSLALIPNFLIDFKLIIQLVLVLLVIFCLVMATVWNRIEKHGILATKLSLSVRLKYLS